MENRISLPIRCRLRKPSTFDKSYAYKPINLENGITALIGLQKGQDNLKVQTLLFNTNPTNGLVWTLGKAKDWMKDNKKSIKSKVFLNDIVKSISIPAPRLLESDKLQKAVETLNQHFMQLPKINQNQSLKRRDKNG